MQVVCERDPESSAILARNAWAGPFAGTIWVARHDDFAGSSQPCDPGGCMDSDTASVAADDRDLAGVEPGPDLDAERPDRLGHGCSAAHRAARTVEQCQEAVAGRDHLATAEPVQL